MKIWKKIAAVSSVVAMILATANSALALNSGSWDLNSGVKNGLWSEIYFGGGPGQPGNILEAADDYSTLTQWFLGGILDPFSTGAQLDPISGHYITKYLTLVALFDGPWGAPADITTGTPVFGMAVNESYFDKEGGLHFTFDFTGTDGEKGVEIKAVFNGKVYNAASVPPTGNYFPTLQSFYVDYLGYPDGPSYAPGHAGVGFDSLTVFVPEASNTLLLLGVAMLGLLPLRRALVGKS